MDASKLEILLLRLSLDSRPLLAGGLSGFPILSVESVTVFAHPKTVLAKDSRERISPRPGLAYVALGADGQLANSIAGRELFPGHSEMTLARFVEKFGDLFDRNEIEIETPDDPFERLLRMT